MRRLRYLEALNEALDQEMARDERVVIWGEDIRRALRGGTKGLLDKYGPDRVVDTPVSEQGFAGMAVGAAFRGLRPVIEYQLASLVFMAFDQMANQAQKLRYMMGGQGNLPITYLITASGARNGLAGQHSDSPYTYMVHAGIKTLIPSSARDVKGLLAAAIREDDPVAVFCPAALLPVRGEVPEEAYTIPLGTGEIRAEGNDVTVVATGELVPVALGTAEELGGQGISVEVLDPRSLLPFDRGSVVRSVSKTGRCVIADDSNRTCGFAAEVSAVVAEECFSSLKAPVKRITRADTPVPYCIPLEKHVLPNKERLVQAIREVTAWERR